MKAIILGSQHLHNRLFHRFPSLYKLAQKVGIRSHQNRFSPVSAYGSLPHHILYSLGHDQKLAQPDRLLPEDVRAINDFLAMARRAWTGIHVIVPIDLSYGWKSLRPIEEGLRILAHYPNDKDLSIGHWNVTSRELSRLIAEMESLGFKINANFHLSDAHRPNGTLLSQPTFRNSYDGATGIFFLTPDRVVLGNLPDYLRHESGYDWPSFTRTIEPNHGKVEHHRSEGKKESRITNIPQYGRYYWGDLEVLEVSPNDNPEDWLNQLDSQSTVIVDSRMANADARLAQCCEQLAPASITWIEPFCIDGQFISEIHEP